MEKYRIYEKREKGYVLITKNATKEQADNYKSDNRVLIIKQTEDRDETYKLMLEKYRNKEDEELER
jgi:hypothetical protein